MATSPPAAHRSRRQAGRQRGGWKRSLANLSHGLLGVNFDFFRSNRLRLGWPDPAPSVVTGHKCLRHLFRGVRGRRRLLQGGKPRSGVPKPNPICPGSLTDGGERGPRVLQPSSVPGNVGRSRYPGCSGWDQVWSWGGGDPHAEQGWEHWHKQDLPRAPSSCIPHAMSRAGLSLQGISPKATRSIGRIRYGARLPVPGLCRARSSSGTNQTPAGDHS